MLAKKAVSAGRGTRDKEAKINAIVHATLELIMAKGYDRVTIRDIVEAADVSVGLIYKYFPKGKIDILTKGFASKTIDSLMYGTPPDKIDFNDFPGYMRAFIMDWQATVDENKPLLKALTMAALHEGEISNDLNDINVKDFSGISEFFGRFKGIDLSDKDPMELLLNWGMTIKGILILNLIYPMPVKSSESLTDLMVDLSLKIWGYKES